MCQIKTVAATFLLFSSAHAADLPTMAAPPASGGTYGASRTDRAVVALCNRAIAQWAAQYNPTDLDTSLAGPIRGRPGETRAARLFVQVVYEREGGPETRSATIDCAVSADGEVNVAEAS
jgi:hypothetical protein